MKLHNPEHRFVSSEEAAQLERQGSSMVRGGESMQEELQEIHSANPALAPNAENAEIHTVYYPWKNTVVEVLDDKNSYDLRTARNIGPRSKEVQDKLGKLSIVVAGGSVGSVAARTLMRGGAGAKLMAFDDDVVSGSNLNRLEGLGWADMNLPKVVALGRAICEMDPYVQYTGVEGRYDENSLDIIRQEHGGMDVCIEAVDDLRAKAQTRQDAYVESSLHMMPTDLGHTSMLDVQMPGDRARLIGISDKNFAKILSNEVSDEEKQKMLVQLVGITNVRPSMLQAFLAYKQGELAGIPQLHSTASSAGALAMNGVEAYVAGEGLSSGRYQSNTRDTLKLQKQRSVQETVAILAQFLKSK